MQLIAIAYCITVFCLQLQKESIAALHAAKENVCTDTEGSEGGRETASKQQSKHDAAYAASNVAESDVGADSVREASQQCMLTAVKDAAQREWHALQQQLDNEKLQREQERLQLQDALSSAHAKLKAMQTTVLEFQREAQTQQAARRVIQAQQLHTMF